MHNALTKKKKTKTNQGKKRKKNKGKMDLHFWSDDQYKTNPYFLLILLLMAAPPLMFLFIQRIKREGIVWRNRRLPPGPMRLPLIGNLHLLDDLSHLSVHRLSSKYGSIMFLQLGSIPTLVVSSADMVRDIFKTHDLVFSGRPLLYAAEKLSYGCSDISFAPYGEYWRKVRKIAVMELLSAKRVQSFQAVRKELVSLMIASVSASSSLPINLSDILLHLANNFICQVAFGRKYDEGSNGNKRGLHEMLQETQNLLGGFCVADFFPWLRWIHKLDGLDAKVERNLRQLEIFYDKMIDEHLDNERPACRVKDFIDVLLQAQNYTSEGITLSRNQMKAVLMDMFIAGTDTSSATVVWAMTELIRNPTMMKRAQQEVRQVTGSKEMVEESDLPQLNYLKLVIKEAMRLHPVAPLLVPRETTEDCTVNGYNIPARTRVFINAKSIMSDPRSWDNPEEFWPDRFMNNSIDFKGQDFEFIPFGIGRRGCPGINFAVVLIELVLANLLNCFNWELPHGTEREDIDMKEAFGLAMHKKVPLCLVATPAKYM